VPSPYSVDVLVGCRCAARRVSSEVSYEFDDGLVVHCEVDECRHLGAEGCAETNSSPYSSHLKISMSFLNRRKATSLLCISDLNWLGVKI